MVEGSQIGAYRIVKRIGEGGMGSVWLAEHSMLGRRAAIKVLHHEFSSKPEIVTRFFNEARAATAIADPGIVQIFDFGHHTDGSAYLVMELLDGEPLDHRLGRVGALELPEALRIMRQVSSTLGAAHARGIVHRDLKPENIFIVRDPEVAGGERAKVLDFGIAKLSGDHAGVKTQTSAVMGTPTYMSPEQCRGAGHVDQRSDIYALGCVLYRLLCGRPPFDADGVGELIAMHLREMPVAPSSLRPGLPAEVEQLMMRCLAKDPAQRFSSGSELAIAIGALIGSSPQVSAPVGGYAAASAPTTLSSAMGASTTPPPGAKNSRLWPIASLGIAAAVAATAIVFMTARSESDDAPTTSVSTVTESPAPTHLTKATAPPTTSDPDREIASRMKLIIERFTAWARDHAGAPCPDVVTLGIEAKDPWGHAFKISCSDQPADQIIGVVSTGPDGTHGTRDDIMSWSFSRELAELVRGARWTIAASHNPPTPGVTATPLQSDQVSAKKQAPSQTTKPVKPKSSSAKPASSVELDENGLPIAR